MAVGIAKRRRTKQQLLTIQQDKLQLQHSDTSSQLQEATAQVTGLARERDQLVEQYLSYSRDLAHQGKRLGEQLAKYQQENCEAGDQGGGPGAARHQPRDPAPGGGYWLLRFSRAENVVKMQGTLGWRTNGRRWMGHGPAGGGLPEGQGGGQLQGGYHDQLDQLEAQLLQHRQSSDCSQEQSCLGECEYTQIVLITNIYFRLFMSQDQDKDMQQQSEISVTKHLNEEDFSLLNLK